ncbi:ATP-binding protein [Pseudomonas sp. FYR_11]|uniref:ATP-binding protein n=1 Tax=Pseudomonas TaxID=286 RepID=UPI00370CD04C
MGMGDLAINFSADPDYIIRGLTSDVATIECIYDLIDNAIDAARKEILKRSDVKFDKHGLPSSYRGFEILVNVSPEQVSISDNCSGIDEESLSKRAFSVGSKSSHRYGIGHFGIGLNRAIFKLGLSAALTTDDGDVRFHLEFDEDKVRKSVKGESTLYARRLSSLGQKQNQLIIRDIKQEVFSELGSDVWLDALQKEIKIRYAIFCRKGLRIKVNDVLVGKFGPKIRDIEILPKRKQKCLTSSGVKVYLEAGLHHSYRIKGVDSDYDDFKDVIKDLTDEYGWYLVCNDRIILVADKTKISGWATSWHNEYHGFLGWAYYVSEDPSLLPWDSKKTGINLNNSAHIEVLSVLKEMADDYRSRNRRARKKDNGPTAASAAGSKGEGGGSAKPGSGSRPAAGSREATDVKTRPLIHTKEMDFLLYDVGTISRSPRLASLVSEAKEISIKEHPYTAMVLLRVLFEAALRDFLIRHSKYSAVKDKYFEEQAEQGRPFSASQKRDFTPPLSLMFSWILSNPEVLPDDVRRATRTSLNSFNKDLIRLNGIIHEDGVLTDYSEAKQIRNNSYKALQTLLGY